MDTKPVEESTTTTLPAAPEHWQDIEELFAHTPCWCQYYRVSSSEYSRRPNEQLHEAIDRHRNALRVQLEGRVSPGVIAYMDDKICGWCGVGVRPGMERLVRSRTIPKVDELPVLSIVCFLVRTGYRRRGVAKALLRGVIDYAKSSGIPAIEAYPVDPAGKRIDTAFAYVGTTSMFEEAGFTRIRETYARSAGLPRWLMRLNLSDNPEK